MGFWHGMVSGIRLFVHASVRPSALHIFDFFYRSIRPRKLKLCVQTPRLVRIIIYSFCCPATSFLRFIFTSRLITCFLLIKLDLVCFNFVSSYFKQSRLGCPRVIARNIKKIALITRPLKLRTFYFTSTSVIS